MENNLRVEYECPSKTIFLFQNLMKNIISVTVTDFSQEKIGVYVSKSHCQFM